MASTSEAMEKAEAFMGALNPKFGLYRKQDAIFRQSEVEFWAEALTTYAAEREREVWEEAARILQIGSDEPLIANEEITLVEQESIKLALRVLAKAFRARAAKEETT